VEPSGARHDPAGRFHHGGEDTGLILQLGEWALAEACRRASAWPSNLRVAVNLSPVQFSAPNLYDTIAGILSTSGLAPDRLELEITERVFMENSDRTLAILHQLKRLGVRIAMDDFGTGYSSLSYLRSFPFDKIKVDRTFISGVVDSGKCVVRGVSLNCYLSVWDPMGKDWSCGECLFKCFKGRMALIREISGGTLAGKMHKWNCDFRISINEMMVEIGKT